MEFSAATKSSRHCALRCSASAGASCCSVAPPVRAAVCRVEQVGQRRGRSLEQGVRAILNRVDARLDFGFRVRVAHLAGAREMFVSGLRTQWSDTFIAPSRL